MVRYWLTTLGVVLLLVPSVWAEKPRELQYLVINCSLNPKAHSAVLAELAVADLKAKGRNVSYVDLRKYNLPLVDDDAGKSYEDPQVKEIHDKIEQADAIIIVAPIYLNAVSGVAKNLLDLTCHKHLPQLSGRAWKNNVVAFMGSSGGKFSHYAFLPFINSLIAHSKIIFVPTYVMASHEDFGKDNKLAPETVERVEGLTSELVRIAGALSPQSN